MTNLTNNNFHFPKSIEASHHQQHMPQHQRHLNLSAKEVLSNGVEESYASNLINRAQPNIQFINNNEGGGDDQMIWRVV